ncbi:MAG: RsmE family RNA methyltransferase [Ginsengibacter sp.]
MQLPFFFEDDIPGSGDFFLSEESSKHITQVLRMQKDEAIHITDGKGKLVMASIITANKKRTEVNISNTAFARRQGKNVAIAISLIKNSSRFEWFLEKATEIGVSEIIPLLCNRTEKQYAKMDRLRNIIVSAMLQSRQSWMPEFKEPTQFSEIVNKAGYDQKFIAHCNDADKKSFNNINTEFFSSIILIGPEGDFTADEINAAIKNSYQSVSLGDTRLRTETAGIVAAVLLLNK